MYDHLSLREWAFEVSALTSNPRCSLGHMCPSLWTLVSLSVTWEKLLSLLCGVSMGVAWKCTENALKMVLLPLSCPLPPSPTHLLFHLCLHLLLHSFLLLFQHHYHRLPSCRHEVELNYIPDSAVSPVKHYRCWTVVLLQVDSPCVELDVSVCACPALWTCPVEEHGCWAGQMLCVRACGERNELACGWGIQLKESGSPAGAGAGRTPQWWFMKLTNEAV